MKYMTFDEVLAQPEGTHIWVANTGIPPKGAGVKRLPKILLSIPKLSGNGKVDIVEIPSTDIPVCLTARVPRRALLESSEFLQAINADGTTSQQLRLCDPIEAKKMFDSPRGKSEMVRIRNEKSLANSTNEQKVIAADGNEENRAPLVDPNSQEAKVNPAVYAMLESADPVRDSEDSAISQLKTIKDKSNEDLKYIIAKASEHGWANMKRRTEHTLEKRLQEDLDEEAA